MNNATRLKKKLTSAKQHFSSGKIYLGMYTLRSSGPFFSTLSMAMVVLSRKKLNISWPMMRKSGKSSIPCPFWLNSAPNTAHMTRQVSRGFSTLQATPSTLRRYFSLKSRVIRFCSR